MAVAIVDTAVLIGMVDANDRNHPAAMEIVRGMDHGDLPVGRVTDYVVLETMNWIHSRQHPEKATETYTRLNKSAGFEIHQTAQKDFTRALELFETDDGLSFGDASTVAYMEREGIEYVYSFDDDFDAIESVTRLETPDNPFS